MPLPSDDNSVGQNIYHALRTDILFGHLAPSTHLRLETLRVAYGASISTLREALSRLAAAELVVAEGQRGFAVAPISRRDLREIADLRILVETRAMELAFTAGDTDWEGSIVAAHHKLARLEARLAKGESDPREMWKDFDKDFHQALIAACGSDALLALQSAVFDKFLRYQMQVISYRGAASIREHRDLVAAAIKRDFERAETILRTHIEGGVAHCLANLPELR